MIAKLLGIFGKAGKVGAVMVGGAYTAEFLKAGFRMASPELDAVVSGPLDTVGSFLDPLDLSGLRAKRREASQVAGSRFVVAKKQAESRKRTTAIVKKAEAESRRALALAEKTAKQASQAAKRGDDALAAEKANRAEQQRRWALLAARTAQASRTECDSKAEALAAAALDLAKTALNPPKGPQEMLSSDMSDAAKSLLADISDAVIRKGTEPDYDRLVARMAEGAAAGYLPDDNAEALDELDELDGPVAGHDHDHEGPCDDDTADEPSEVSGPCCASCGLTGSSCGTKKGPVPDYFLFGPSVGGDLFGEDDDADPELLSFDPDGDNWLVSGPDDGSALFGG